MVGTLSNAVAHREFYVGVFEMSQSVDQLLSQLATNFFAANYDYIWLRTMLDQAQHTTTPGSTLIVGSSHALNAIRECEWKHAVNCSMHSQDLYYDLLCVRRVLTSAQRVSLISVSLLWVTTLPIRICL